MEIESQDNGDSQDPAVRLADLDVPCSDDGKLILRGQVLANRDLSGLDFSGTDLTGSDLSGSDLSNANFMGADLTDTKLQGVKLDGTEFLDACLKNANLSEAHGEHPGFARANLQGCDAVGARLKNASFSEAKLEGANLGGAVLEGGRFRSAVLSRAQLIRTNLRGCDLSAADLDGADLQLADLHESTMAGVKGYKTANWIGVNVVNVDFHGAYLVRRHVMDENYLHEFREQGRLSRVVYWVWWLTSDCGRSLLRWTAWVGTLIVVYALAYMVVGIDYGKHETALSPLYFSIVTVTTLGYGDALPASIAGQLLAVSEAILGYVGLGGLLSIFAQKMARRAE
jgi:uncharacterized protein YjbI with pentapeptide repeats